jgi:hypothetical protein
MRRLPLIGSTSVSLREATAGETDLISSKYPLADEILIDGLRRQPYHDFLQQALIDRVKQGRLSGTCG